MSILDRIFGAPHEMDPHDGDPFMIVGLGNPGREYVDTRHNIGFMAIDALAKANHLTLTKVQNKAIITDFRLGSQKVFLAKPQTYMNRSGDSVGPLAKFYRIPNQNILIIYDELDLALGTVRIREKGSAGGHNGMRSIIQHLGPEVPRLRLGIDRPAGKMPVKAYVLRDFGRDEVPIVREMLDRATSAVHTFVTDGIELAMSRFNGQVAM